MSEPYNTHGASLPTTNTTAPTGVNVFQPLAYSSAQHKDVSSFYDGIGTGTSAGAKTISAAEQRGMMDSIIAIFQLEEDEDREMKDEEDEEDEVDLEDQHRRTERLRGALDVLGKLWWARSEHVETVTEKLADGSRDRELIQQLSFQLLSLIQV